MSDASNYLEDAIIDHVFRNTALTSPTTVYVALFTAVSDAEAGTGTEVSGGAYARQAVTFAAPSNGVTGFVPQAAQSRTAATTERSRGACMKRRAELPRWPGMPVLPIYPEVPVTDLVQGAFDRLAPALARRLTEQREERHRAGRVTREDEDRTLFDTALSIELGERPPSVEHPAVAPDDDTGPESVAVEHDVLARKLLVRVLH